MPLTDQNKLKATKFEVDFDMRNIFDHPHKIEIDPSDTSPFKDFLLFDYVNENHKCIKGSSYSRLREYCEFFSHSREICISYRMCSWKPNELSTATTFSDQHLKACQPCT